MNILLAGQCGSGKTWVMKELIKRNKLNQLGKIGMVYFHRNDKVVVAGKFDGSTFEGTDKLSMAVMADIDELVKVAKQKKYLFIAEGDRFTNSTFLEKAKPIVIRILDDGSKGRKKRKSNQTERQIKAVATRVSRLSPTHDVLDSNVALSIIQDYIDGKR